MGKYSLLVAIVACSIFVTSSQLTDEVTATPFPRSFVTEATHGRIDPSSMAKRPTGTNSNGPAASPDMTDGTGNNKTGNGHGGSHDSGDANGDRQPVKPPTWTQCLSEVTDEDQSGTDIISVFKVWCGNYDALIECLSRDLPANAFTNPFDFFIYLNFNPIEMQNKSRNFCSEFEGMDTKLTCAKTQNESIGAACGHGFSRGLFHIFDLYTHRDVPDEILQEIACDVTTQTTFCLKQTLPDCDDDVISSVLNYYALFTNDTCLSQPGDAPLNRNPPPPKRPETVIIKCANEAAQSLSADQSEAQPTSLVDFVILGLKADCKTYSTRYACYHRELRNITNFMDFWLSLTFDYDNALASQKGYCAQVEDSIIPRLTNECFNQSQPGLSECEAGFSREVETIRRELLENTDFDRLELQTIACRTSVTRAVCLGNAMKHCGEEIASAMSVSEMGILPGICRQLLARANNHATDANVHEADTHQDGDTNNGRDQDHAIRESNNPDGMAHNNDESRMEMPGHNDRPVNDMGYSGSTNPMNDDKIKESTGQMDKDKDTNRSASESHSDDDMDAGVGVLRVNGITLTCVVCLMLIFVGIKL